MAAIAAIGLSAFTVFVFLAGMFSTGQDYGQWVSAHPLEAAVRVTGWIFAVATSGVLAAYCWKRAFKLHDEGY